MPRGNPFERLRKQLGMRSAEMAKALGTSRQRWSQIESGECTPSLSLLTRIWNRWESSFHLLGFSFEDLAKYVEKQNAVRRGEK